MSELVLIHRAVQESEYTARHISLLLRQGKIAGQKEGRIWFVDLDDLRRYEAEMKNDDNQRYDPTKNK
jgi:formylmethanofuran dehydrogenase subunit A